jgi:DNA-binding NarL/FixJ family response regulator
MTSEQRTVLPRTRILLADDHPIFRAGVRRVLEQEPDLQVLAEVGDGASCVAQAAILSPDLIIADVSMPHMDGFDVGEWIRQNLPQCRFIMISMYSADGFVEKAKQVGASGFVAKEDAADELLSAIRARRECFYASASAGGKGPQTQNAAIPEPRDEDLMFRDMIGGLTRSELRVLQLLSLSSKKFDLRGPNKLLELAIRHRDQIPS